MAALLAALLGIIWILPTHARGEETEREHWTYAWTASMFEAEAPDQLIEIDNATYRTKTRVGAPRGRYPPTALTR